MKRRQQRESIEGKALMQWVRLHTKKHPELALFHHIPNGGGRSKAEAGRLKAEGVLPGIPDYFLPAARAPHHGQYGPYHGLYLELKAPKTGSAPLGTVSTEQKNIMEKLRWQGYFVAVCYGWEQSAATIKAYLDEQ